MSVFAMPEVQRLWNGVKDRRKSDRFSHKERVEIFSAQGGKLLVTGDVIDLSVGGIGIHIPQPLADVRIMISGTAVRRHAVVRYCNVLESGYRIGCQFVDHHLWL